LAGASAQPGSPLALDQFLQDVVLDINQWPVLRELACNRADPWIPTEDALALRRPGAAYKQRSGWPFKKKYPSMFFLS